MHRLIDFSLRNKFLVLVLTAVMVGFGVRAMLRLPIDAVPDVTPNQVLVLTRRQVSAHWRSSASSPSRSKRR